MFDPFTSWSRMTSAWFDLAQTAARAASVTQASRQIIDRRSNMIGEAMRSPLTGNYAELSRMVPEKVAAFSQSAASVSSDIFRMQTAFMAEWQNLASMALSGKMPSFMEMSDQMTRSLNYATRSSEELSALARNALAPVHKTVSSNSKRLKVAQKG